MLGGGAHFRLVARIQVAALESCKLPESAEIVNPNATLVKGEQVLLTQRRGKDTARRGETIEASKVTLRVR